MGFFSVLLLFNFPSIVKRIRAKVKISNVNGTKIASALLFSSILAGMLDGTGNVLYALSIQEGIIILAGSMIALLPVTLALTGKFIFHEKLTSMQYSGILLSVTGAMLIAIL
jgi:drug/metabolite transporter (DMT)-like permease